MERRTLPASETGRQASHGQWSWRWWSRLWVKPTAATTAIFYSFHASKTKDLEQNEMLVIKIPVWGLALGSSEVDDSKDSLWRADFSLRWSDRPFVEWITPQEGLSLHKMEWSTVLVFGLDVSYERSRLENRGILRHFSVRVFFCKTYTNQMSSISRILENIKLMCTYIFNLPDIIWTIRSI